MTGPIGPIAPKKDFLTDIDVLVRERDEARAEVKRLTEQWGLEAMTQECHRLRDLANRDNARALDAERQRDMERARADAAEATLARVNADAAEMVDRVKHLAWVSSGAPMKGERAEQTPGLGADGWAEDGT